MAKRVNGSGVGVVAGLVGVAGLLAASGAAMGQGGCEPGEIYGSEQRIGLSSGTPNSIAVGDLNKDGNPDVVVNGSLGFSVLLGNGDGSFRVTAYDTPGRLVGLKLGDVDTDGNLDVVAAGSRDVVNVFLNNGDGTFPAALQYPAIFAHRDIALSDLNGDGVLDIGVCQDNADTAILLNLGDGTFDPPRFVGTGPGENGIEFGDLDADGDNDMVIANGFATNQISILLNNGDATFLPPTMLFVNSRSQSSLLEDLNGDGSLDIASINSFDVSILLNRGDATFEPRADYAVGEAALGGAIADVNGDGLPDIITANQNSDDVSLLLGNGDGTFAEQVRFGVGGVPQDAAVGDFDNDGDLDLAVCNQNSIDISILFNRCTVAPAITVQPPAITVADRGEPVSLAVEVTLGTPPLSYQWRKDGQPLADGGHISGATTDTLSFDAARITDADRYDVVVSNAQGEVTSDTAVLTVRTACAADFDGDGELTLFDFLAFQNAFAAGCP